MGMKAMDCASGKRVYIKPMIDILELDIEDAVLANSGGGGSVTGPVGGGSVGEIPDFMKSSTNSTSSSISSSQGNSDIWGN